MGFGKEKPNHAHYAAVFLLSLANIGLLIAALNLPWYQVSKDYTIFGNTPAVNTTYTYDFVGLTEVTTSGSSSSTSQKQWNQLNMPHTFAIYQSTQSFSLIAVILSGGVGFGCIIVWLASCCSKGLRDVVKILVGIVSLAVIVFCVLSWAVFLGLPKAITQDYPGNNAGLTCDSNQCTSFKGTNTDGTPLLSWINTWGPAESFWIVIAATAVSLAIFVEIVREARC